MKHLYRSLALVAVVAVFYTGVEKKGSFDITEGLIRNQDFKAQTFEKRGSFDDELAVSGGGSTGDVVIISG